MTSELQIQNAGNLTIEPASTSLGPTSLVGSVIDRVLEIDGGSVTLTGLTIYRRRGCRSRWRHPGQNASLTLRNTRVNSNISTQAGAGIFTEGGSLDVMNSTVIEQPKQQQFSVAGRRHLLHGYQL